MTMYDDLFFRTNLSDEGTIPSPGLAYTSPDIIPYGLSPVSDPQDFFTRNYNADVGQDLITKASNYIYLRAKNLAVGAQQGLASLYYSPASLLLYPSQWQSNQLKTSDNLTQVAVSAPSANAIAVTTNPFVWTPSAIGGGDHYCLISRVSTSQHDNPIPATGGISDFTQFILDNPGFGWRNVALTDANSPTFTTSVQFSQGNEAGQMYFLLDCRNVPAGASVAFSAGTPGPTPLISLQKTTVPQNNGSWTVGMQSLVPANYATQISYSYWANGTTPLPGFSLTLRAVPFFEAAHSLYSRLFTPHQLGVPRALIREVGAKKGITAGSHTTLAV
jgi:hypothetical protein